MKDQRAPHWTRTPQSGCQINSTDVSADGAVCLAGTSQEYGTGDFAVYCYDREGKPRWNDPLGNAAYQGVFWVAVSANGHLGAAGGTISQTADAAGFLRAYRIDDGTRLLDQRLPSRVNQVDLSDDGQRLVAVCGDRLHVYDLQDGRFVKLAEQAFTNEYCRSCAISGNGKRIVVGTSLDSSGSLALAADGRTSFAAATDTGGAVHLLEVDGGTLKLRVTSHSDCGIMHVAMLGDGSWWAASRHDGKAAAFNQDTSLADGTPAWIYGPADMSLDVAYGIAIARGTDHAVRVVCGANLADAENGCVYAVRTRQEAGDASRCVPVALWQHALEYQPNPGINMDRDARWVTATDGQPQTGSPSETPGNFYLIEVDSGRLSWRYGTPVMNWPMAISADGHAVFGGSDDGSVYYWKQG